jgi:hypothetical protein
MKFNAKALYYFVMGALGAAGTGVSTYLATPEAGVQLGEVLGNAGIAALVLPLVMYVVSFLLKLIPQKPDA